MTAFATSTPSAAAPAASPIDTTGNLSSGPSPTLHLLGVGKVGQAFLRHLDADRFRLLAATDSTATLHAERGLALDDLLRCKREARGFASLPGAESLPLELVLGLTRAELVVDALPSSAADGEQALRRCRAVLRAGKKLVLASKDALAVGIDRILGEIAAGRVGIHAALGGTGQPLVRELGVLRASCTEIAIVANASTTRLVLALERGRSLAEGIASCQSEGVLEPDPKLDLDGTDAATKLAIVARAVFDLPLDPARILREDARALDPAVLQARHARGCTTRLVGRVRRDGVARVGYEEIALGSVLRVPADRVVYVYRTQDGRERVHVGTAIGAEATAAALVEDLLVLTGGVA